MRPRRTLMATTMATAMLVAGGVGGCGTEESEGEITDDRVQRLADCIDGTSARAATADSILDGAVGAVDMLGPSAAIHVFVTEADAAAEAKESGAVPKVRIGSLVVYEDDPATLEIVRGCA